jgi:predicted DNA-binding transcriptional regulator AlpA
VAPLYGGPANAEITATVRQFSELPGLGKTTIFEMIRAGALPSAMICGGRLIDVEAYREMVKEQVQQTASVRINPANRHAFDDG